MICMTVWDFVIGVLFGIVVSCKSTPLAGEILWIDNVLSKVSSLSFKTPSDAAFARYSRETLLCLQSVGQASSGHTSEKWPSRLRSFDFKASDPPSSIISVHCSERPGFAGFLFFGTITYVEEAIRELIDGPSYQKNPVQFLVLDFANVAGVDMSSAEALVRVQRLLAAKCITLVMCGFEVDSPVGKALDSVGLLAAERVELFSTFNDAMEWTENVYLRTWYRQQKHEVATALG